MPLIIDKLFSNLKTAKLDSLNLLCRGVRIFNVKGLERHLTELWSVLRKEIVPGGDVELKDASLKAVVAIVEVVSNDTKLCESFIDNIITDSKSSLYDIQLSLFRPTIKLLECIAAVNKESCMQVLRTLIPLCLGQYSTKTSLTDKTILIEALNTFIKISSDHGFNIKSMYMLYIYFKISVFEKCLKHETFDAGVPELSWTDIPQLYLNELSIEHVELQSQLLIGLTIQKMYLSETQRNLLYDKICNLIETSCNEIRTICHISILTFAKLHSHEILTLIRERFQLNTGK